MWERGYSTYVMKRINRIYEYKKDNKNNEWISNDKEGNFVIFSIKKLGYQIEARKCRKWRIYLNDYNYSILILYHRIEFK